VRSIRVPCLPEQESYQSVFNERDSQGTRIKQLFRVCSKSVFYHQHIISIALIYALFKWLRDNDINGFIANNKDSLLLPS
jgi:hypothetical protein